MSRDYNDVEIGDFVIVELHDAGFADFERNVEKYCVVQVTDRMYWIKVVTDAIEGVIIVPPARYHLYQTGTFIPKDGDRLSWAAPGYEATTRSCCVVRNLGPDWEIDNLILLKLDLTKLEPRRTSFDSLVDRFSKKKGKV